MAHFMPTEIELDARIILRAFGPQDALGFVQIAVEGGKEGGVVGHERIAMVYDAPAEIANQLVSVPICTGLDVEVVAPRPSAPSVLDPQAHTEPVVLRAVVCRNPAETKYQSDSAPTWTGLERFAPPVPKDPYVLEPHAHNVLSVLMAKVKPKKARPPHDTDDQLLKVPI